jgi:hypothetical protein
MLDRKLRVGFNKLFPQYAKELNAAKSQEEILSLHSRFMSECSQNLEEALAANNLLGQENEKTCCFVLTKETYKVLINATGNTIKHQLQVLIDDLQRLKDMEKDNPVLATAEMIGAGVVAIGLLSTTTVVAKLTTGVLTAAAAALAGATAVTIGVIIAIVALVIVAIIGVIYFMVKPAVCLALLINELDRPIVFEDHYNVHGKPTLATTPIPNGAIISGEGLYPVAGFIVSEKKTGALIGTQYGCTYKYSDTKLAFGMACPLTRIYTDNNCYCAFDVNAKTAAKNTVKHNKRYYEATQGNLKLSIRCNSRAGSIAYYVARAYFAHI